MRNTRRRDRAGLSLFGAALALALFGVFVASGMEWLQQRAREGIARIAGAQAIALSEAAGSWVASTFSDRLTAGAEDVSLATLRTAGVLAPGFAAGGIDALGRTLRVLTRPVGADALDVLVTHVPRTGDQVFPIKAVLVGNGKARIGLVHPGETVLRGPTVAADISGFRAQFTGAPADFAIGVLERHDRESVYGDFLYRDAVSGLADANRMSTQLDMGGNDVVDAKEIQADRLVLENGLEVGTDLTVTEDLLIEGDLEVTGKATVTNDVTAGTADVAGALRADSAVIAGEARAGSVAASGSVSGGRIRTHGVLSAGDATVTHNVRAGSVGAFRVTAGDVEAGTVRSGRVTGTSGTVGTVSATSGQFSTLTVGVCHGCGP